MKPARAFPRLHEGNAKIILPFLLRPCILDSSFQKGGGGEEQKNDVPFRNIKKYLFI